ncbi:penicillin-binding protein 2 [Candidatus Synechococcus calcipolaris G9]|uniref:Penicillin-binding protein 2 n=1 Tax=Candidatus Synechococcus calcipolaris G9 TaxID=1497997 RepID=A0ABT6EW68_9SYNE|nr:penicillin-binding protein 2 [Candidatus Synechococcus calcipolaris]MDG2990000.1 penicillin-binding protein 2 [Candidatus Synechococcus calcipolaris G9]
MTMLKTRSTGFQAYFRTVGKEGRGIVLLVIVSLLLVAGMGSRLAYLQIVEGQRNRQLADENRIRLIPKPPERGKILDRKGRVLAGNSFSYSVFVWPMAAKKSNWPRTLELLAQILKVPEEEINHRVQQAGVNSPSLIRVAQGISQAQIVALEEHRAELEGIEIDREAMRLYPHGEIAAHILGYIGELNAEELEERRDQGYRLGDVIGQMGVEASYEETLRGTWGGQQVEVDGEGKVIRILGQKIARPGNDITLSIDLDVQRAAEAALGNRTGAIVAMDPEDGSILALVSRPAFDPNWFARRMSESQWQELQRRQNPFVNRALQGFPPASTYKIVTATAGLESEYFGPDSVLMTYSALNTGGFAFHDWNRAGFGSLGFAGALAWSSNTFFGQVARRIGPESLIDWSRRYGMGEKTGIDLPGEAAGFIPTPEWKEEVFGEGWYDGDSLITSIGQGALQVSPLQAAVMFAVPANNGYRVRPHLIRSTENPDKWRQSLNLQPSTVSVLRQGLRQVVTGGTGAALNVPNIAIAGKSGTGEDPPRPHHTWFGGYAPADKPEIVVVAFAENSGGGGGSVGGPMVLNVIQAYVKHNSSK